MRNLLGVAILTFALSLCNLGDRLKDLGKAQNSNQSTNQNSNQSNANTSAETEEPPAPVDSNQNTASGDMVSGGMLNDKAVSLPRPAYPPVAKAAGASGTVVVQVIVDETGKVTSAKAVSGHPLLRQAAAQAAYRASFKPIKLNGKPVKVSGTISYDFTRE
jgi:TonB family protein